MEKYEAKVYCSYCKKTTNHYSLKRVEQGHDDFLTERQKQGIDDIENHFSVTYNIGQCCGCDTINFFETYYDEYFLPYEGEKVTTFPPMPYYLESANDIHFRKFSLLPRNIKKILQEIQVSLSSDKPQPLLLTIGIRMILEAITIELKIKSGWVYKEEKNSDKSTDYVAALTEKGNKRPSKSLHNKLYKMYENKIISKSQFEILTKIKNHGNAATHELIVPEYSIILKMYSVTEDVLYQQFELERIGI